MQYAGDITPAQAWQLLFDDTKAQLVDVRTDAEWTFVGLPDLTAQKKEPILLPWQVYPSMGRNAEFVDLLAARLKKDTPIAFLCRSGGRSAAAAAAMSAAGFTKCYNIAGGFEGDVDEEGHRGTTNGWKAANLPWRQG